MDPLAQAMQLLQEAGQTIQLLSEEVQTLREQNRGKVEGKKDISKTASVVELGAIFGMDYCKLPEFVKEASADEARAFLSLVESNVRYSSLGKVAEYNDGSSFDNPADTLESRLSNILG